VQRHAAQQQLLDRALAVLADGQQVRTDALLGLGDARGRIAVLEDARGARREAELLDHGVHGGARCVARLAAVAVDLGLRRVGELQRALERRLEGMQQVERCARRQARRRGERRRRIVREVDRDERPPVGSERLALHHEHRCRAPAHHALGGGAQGKVADRMLAARTHHHHVAAGGRGAERIGDRAPREPGLEGKAGLALELGRQRLQRMLHRAARLEGELCRERQFGGDMQQCSLCTVLAGEQRRAQRGVARVFREIGRDEQRLEGGSHVPEDTQIHVLSRTP